MKVILSVIIHNNSTDFRCFNFPADAIHIQISNTCRKVKAIRKAIGRTPARIVRSPNRDHNAAFQSMRKFASKLGWDLYTTYGLFIEQNYIPEGELKTVLKHESYSLLERSKTNTNQNTRLIRLSADVEAIGVIHPRWITSSRFLPDIVLKDTGKKHAVDIMIDDEIDSFYYAWALYCNKRYKHATSMFKKYESGNEDEMYIRALTLGKLLSSSKWYQAAISVNPSRPEAYYYMAKLYTGKIYYEWLLDAYYADSPSGILHEHNIKRVICHELSAVCKKYDVKIGLEASTFLLDTESSGWSNIKHYLTKPNIEWIRPFDVEPMVYNACNTSIIPYGGGYLCCMRETTYDIYEQKFPVYNANQIIFMDSDFAVTKRYMLEDVPYGNKVQGIEDLRLVNYSGKVFMSGNIRTSDTKIEMAVSELHPVNFQFMSTDRMCEKNWLPFDDKYIYEFSPFTITDGKNICFTQDYPLKNARGSAGPVPYKNGYISIIHYAWKYTYYFHRLVYHDANMKIISTSKPFIFEQLGIEFCIGAVIKDDLLVMIYTVYDRNPKIIAVKPF